jgi:hypothetical protein
MRNPWLALAVLTLASTFSLTACQRPAPRAAPAPRADPAGPALAAPAPAAPAVANPATRVSAAPPPVVVIDCARPRPVVQCCQALTEECNTCARNGRLLERGYDLKCVQQVPRSYRACGCGCCGGVGPGPRQCLHFSRGEDIREIIARDRQGRDPERCATVGCSLGRVYAYCD